MRPDWLTIMFAAVLAVSNPVAAEDDLPPLGRSRFDLLIGNAPTPYPFAKLATKINAQMQQDPGGLPPLKVTLIPLGRSLQKNAGAPDFFHFPRVVAAADGINQPGFEPLKDRLFIGYHEKGAVLEVISYNDAAGRFEFQVVRDYQAGKTPQVYYARRSLCLACHQNAAPIFARPLWDETSANPAIAKRLRDTRRDFYGVKLSGTDIAYFIDAAADRANLFSVWQTLWQHGCGAGESGDRCRMEAFDAALDYARNRTLPAPTDLPALDRNWAAHWPQGLPVPNPDLPNRDPLAAAANPMLADPANDPLLPRTPLEIWRTPDKTAFIVGLAGMLDARAVRSLPRDLAAPLERLRLRGVFAARPFGLSLLDALRSELLIRHELTMNVGRALSEGVSLGTARQVGLKADLQSRIKLAALIGKPRARVYAALPRAQVEPASAARADNPLVAPFRTHCASCHDTTLPHPPNFLHGSPAEVEAQLNQCAARIFVRLSMNGVPESARVTSPMPPATALASHGVDPRQWRTSPELAALKRSIETRLRVPAARLLTQPYNRLPPCLPQTSPQHSYAAGHAP